MKRKIFDDSKSLSVALYVTAVSFTIGLPLQFLFFLQLQVVFAYMASATWVNVSAYGTLICVFLPKFWAIVIKKDSGKEVRSISSVWYISHPERCRSKNKFSQSPELTTETTIDICTVESCRVPINDSLQEAKSVRNAVPKTVSFNDSLDFIW